MNWKAWYQALETRTQRQASCWVRKEPRWARISGMSRAGWIGVEEVEEEDMIVADWGRWSFVTSFFEFGWHDVV